MKIEYITVGPTYSAHTTGILFDDTYDYCLFRQDVNGKEVICFHFYEVDDILEMIDRGEIKVYHDNTILYCKDAKTYNKFPKATFSCVSTIY